MANARRFFRFDVKIHIYLQREFTEGLRAVELLQSEQSSQLQSELNLQNARVQQLLIDLSNSGSVFYQTLYAINHRMNYFAWLLLQFIEQQDPTRHPEFKFRARDDLKHKPPVVKKDSPTSHLIAGIYAETENLLKSVKSSIANSLDDRLFIFPEEKRENFNTQFFVTNLDALVTKKVPVAIVLDAMIKKLNSLNQLYNLLKKAYAPISYSEFWPLRDINLSAGGISFITDSNYEPLESVNVFMALDSIVLAEGKILYSKQIQQEEGNSSGFRTAIEFVLPSSKTQEQIKRFLQHREIKQAMKLYPQVTSWEE